MTSRLTTAIGFSILLVFPSCRAAKKPADQSGLESTSRPPNDTAICDGADTKKMCLNHPSCYELQKPMDGISVICVRDAKHHRQISVDVTSINAIVAFFANKNQSKPVKCLRSLEEEGLAYLKLGYDFQGRSPSLNILTERVSNDGLMSGTIIFGRPLGAVTGGQSVPFKEFSLNETKRLQGDALRNCPPEDQL